LTHHVFDTFVVDAFIEDGKIRVLDLLDTRGVDAFLIPVHRLGSILRVDAVLFERQQIIVCFGVNCLLGAVRA